MDAENKMTTEERIKRLEDWSYGIAQSTDAAEKALWKKLQELEASLAELKASISSK